MGTTLRPAVLVVTVLIAAGCHVDRPVSPKPITAEVAREMAIAQFTSSEPVNVLWVRRTTIGAAMQGTGAADPNAAAWEVRLSGSFYSAHSCAPDDVTSPPCGPHPTTALAVIAVATGEVWGQFPAP